MEIYRGAIEPIMWGGWASDFSALITALFVLLAGWRWDYVLRKRQKKADTIRELRGLLEDLQDRGIEYWTEHFSEDREHDLEILARKIQAKFHLLSKKVVIFRQRHELSDDTLMPLLAHLNHVMTGEDFGARSRKVNLEQISVIYSRGSALVLELERLLE
jgi:hypothetical protein